MLTTVKIRGFIDSPITSFLNTVNGLSVQGIDKTEMCPKDTDAPSWKTLTQINNAWQT